MEIDGRIRFSSDQENFQKLLEDEVIGTLAKTRLKDVQEDGYRRNLLGNSLRISKTIAPSLYNQVTSAQTKLGLEDKTIEIYIYNDADANATCAYLGGDRIILTFSSGLLHSMTTDELNFIVGHELGHALFQHYALPTHGILDDGRVDAEQAMRLMSWSRRAEISADRAGLYICQSVDAVINSFLKLSCGVADPMITFNRDEYTLQIQDLGGMVSNLEDTAHCYSSHPFNPIRVLAAELYSKSAEYAELTGLESNGDNLSIEKVDEEIDKVLDFMEPVSSDAQKEIVDLCVFWAGAWIALADGAFVEAEHKNLKEQVAEEIYDRNIVELFGTNENKIAQAEEKFYQSVGPLKTLSSADRCALVQRLIVVARCDQHIDEKEYAVLYKVCNELKVEHSFVEQILNFLN